MHTQYPFRARAGFNMMEVLVALGIFALGFTTIAALFPAGALLQRRTADDISSRHVERSARAVVKATELDPADELSFYTIGDTHLEPFPTDSTATPAPPPYLDDVWSLDTRSYPAAIVDPELRDYYWLPLVREDSGSGGDWQMIVFVLKRRSDASYTDKDYGPSDDSIPGIRRLDVDEVADEDSDIPGDDTFKLPSDESINVRINDSVVASNGGIYSVAAEPTTDSSGRINVKVRSTIDGSPTELWYAPPPDGSDISPAHRVFNVSPSIVTGP